MTFIEIKQSGPDIPDAVYPLILTDIKGDPDRPGEPKHVVPEKGPNAGKDLYFWDWQFAVDAPGHPLDGYELEYGTSLATGPKSKMFPLLVALLDGVKPQVGQTFSMDQLKGRRVLGTVQHDEAGVSRIIGFSAKPAAMPAAGASTSPAGFGQAGVQPSAAPTIQQQVAAPAAIPIQQIVPTQQEASAGQPAPTPDLPF